MKPAAAVALRGFPVLIGALVAVAGLTVAAPARADQPQGRDVIAQMFGWNWRSIARECRETLGPQGYGAVQTSPPAEHAVLPERGFPWWQSYSPVSYSLDSRWGTRGELAEMVRSCHDAGVEVYADVIVNNMSGVQGCGTGSAGARFCHLSYPAVPYGPEDFHHCGTPKDAVYDYRDRYQVHNCQSFGTADLATEEDRVRDRIAGYLDDLMSLGIDGFRIDSAKHIPPEDLSAIERRLHRPAYVYQEVIYGPGEAVQPEEYLATGDVMDLRYAGSLSSTFRQGRLTELRDFGSALPSGKSVVFVANHDTARSGITITPGDADRYVLAHAFMLAWPYGRPKVLSDYEFVAYDQPPPSDLSGRAIDAACGGPVWLCEHSWPGIAGMVGFRRQVGNAPVVDWSDDGGDLVAFGRGREGYLVLNGAGSAVTDRLYRTSLPAGRYCDVMHGTMRSGSCTGPVYEVDDSGDLHADIGPRSGIALHAGATVSR
ncbi:alpha-amylase [Nocardia mexicana]|uniref:Alpha-amylase n=1 Tax=Nocardia mexicana TaxID=279262 RepID=A0A370HEE7_9NOCA|nr:alpha-amylase family protein [Nocardia mexicana]RDI53253.1 alpha-amylase [Nocardia mexicana]